MYDASTTSLPMRANCVTYAGEFWNDLEYWREAFYGSHSRLNKKERRVLPDLWKGLVDAVRHVRVDSTGQSTFGNMYQRVSQGLHSRGTPLFRVWSRRRRYGFRDGGEFMYKISEAGNLIPPDVKRSFAELLCMVCDIRVRVSSPVDDAPFLSDARICWQRLLELAGYRSRIRVKRRIADRWCVDSTKSGGVTRVRVSCATGAQIMGARGDFLAAAQELCGPMESWFSHRSEFVEVWHLNDGSSELSSRCAGVVSRKTGLLLRRYWWAGRLYMTTEDNAKRWRRIRQRYIMAKLPQGHRYVSDEDVDNFPFPSSRLDDFAHVPWFEKATKGKFAKFIPSGKSIAEWVRFDVAHVWSVRRLVKDYLPNTQGLAYAKFAENDLLPTILAQVKKSESLKHGWRDVPVVRGWVQSRHVITRLKGVEYHWRLYNGTMYPVVGLDEKNWGVGSADETHELLTSRCLMWKMSAAEC